VARSGLWITCVSIIFFNYAVELEPWARVALVSETDAATVNTTLDRQPKQSSGKMWPNFVFAADYRPYIGF
jgi:hypothetical protein